MKKNLPFLLFIFILRTASSQNLVLNADLESYLTCPGFGQFDSIFVEHWTKPSWGSTDYYHDSCTGIQPVSQVPHSGHAYFGIIGYNYGTEYREYATGRLSAPLQAGHAYSVEFYVSLNDGYIQAINELGALFSTTAPGPYSNFLHIPVTPQVENTSGILGSTTIWMLVSGIFTASGGEQYITIGNFHDDSSTTITQVGNVGSYGAYYFVDDVLVTEAKGTGNSEISTSQITVEPNPSAGFFKIVSPQEASIQNMEVFDCFGKEIISESAGRNEIDLGSFSAGIYILQIYTRDGVTRKKLIRN